MPFFLFLLLIFSAEEYEQVKRSAQKMFLIIHLGNKRRLNFEKIFNYFCIFFDSTHNLIYNENTDESMIDIIKQSYHIIDNKELFYSDSSMEKYFYKTMKEYYSLICEVVRHSLYYNKI